MHYKSKYLIADTYITRNPKILVLLRDEITK